MGIPSCITATPAPGTAPWYARMRASIRGSGLSSWNELPVDTKGAPILARIGRAGSWKFPRGGQNPLAKLRNFGNCQEIFRTHEVISGTIRQRPFARDPQRTLLQCAGDQGPTRERISQ